MIFKLKKKWALLIVFTVLSFLYLDITHANETQNLENIEFDYDPYWQLRVKNTTTGKTKKIDSKELETLLEKYPQLKSKFDKVKDNIHYPNLSSKEDIVETISSGVNFQIGNEIKAHNCPGIGCSVDNGEEKKEDFSCSDLINKHSPQIQCYKNQNPINLLHAEVEINSDLFNNCQLIGEGQPLSVGASFNFLERALKNYLKQGSLESQREKNKSCSLNQTSLATEYSSYNEQGKPICSYETIVNGKSKLQICDPTCDPKWHLKSLGVLKSDEKNKGVWDRETLIERTNFDKNEGNNSDFIDNNRREYNDEKNAKRQKQIKRKKNVLN